MNIAETMVVRDRESPESILVVGDGMTDVYVQGRVEDTCQERCPKFIVEASVTVPGGAENAARSLSHWKAAVNYVGPPRGHSPVKTRYMFGNRCVLRCDDDKSVFDVELVRSVALERLRSGNPPGGVLLSDYDKGTLSPRFILEVSGICAERDIPCVADCKLEPRVYAGCVLKGNADYWRKHDSLPGARMVETRGSSSPRLHHVRIPNLPPVKCVNHVGAGDCFAAHLVLALAYGFSLKEAAAIAHSAGRVYVQRLHNHPPRPEEVVADMSAIT